MRIHCLENVDKALQFLKEQRVHLENVGSHDIVDGNHRLTLGLIWTIILRFQVNKSYRYLSQSASFLVVGKPGGNCRQLLLKTLKEDEEQTQEATANLTAAKEILDDHDHYRDLMAFLH